MVVSIKKDYYEVQVKCLRQTTYNTQNLDIIQLFFDENTQTYPTDIDETNAEIYKYNNGYDYNFDNLYDTLDI